MYKILLCIRILLLAITANSQVSIKGNIIDDKTRLPVEGATITLMPVNIFAVTDARGRFYFKGKYDTTVYILIHNIGFATQKFTADEIRKNNILLISHQQIELQNVSYYCQCRGHI